MTTVTPLVVKGRDGLLHATKSRRNLATICGAETFGDPEFGWPGRAPRCSRCWRRVEKYDREETG